MKNIYTTAIAILLLSASGMVNAKDCQGADDELFCRVSKKVDECRPHFDISTFLKYSLTGDDDVDLLVIESIDEAFINYAETGDMKLTPEQKANPMAVKCAAFAEGFFLGATSQYVLLSLLVDIVVEEIMESIITGDTSDDIEDDQE